MRRLAIKLALFLLLGAIVNVAVAWGIEIRSAKSRRSVIRANWKENDRENWTVMVRYTGSCHIFTSDDPLFAEAFLDGLTGRSTGQPDTSRIAELTAFPPWSFSRSPDWHGAPALERMAINDVASGWPLWSVRCRLMGGIGSRDVQIRGGMRLPPKVISHRTATIYKQRPLPLTPIWLGFAINTIFYAAVLWVLFLIPGTMKRHRRRVRGRCIYCGYDLRGQPPPEAGKGSKCPECGGMVLVKSSISRERMGLPPPATPAEET